VPHTIDPITDWQTRLRDRLASQFRDKPNLLAWVDAYAAQIQELETSGQLLLTITSIDDSEGSQLDVIGGIVGQGRAGETDVVYRLYLKARIRTNRSSGTPEEIYAVLRAMMPTNSFSIVNSGTATLVATIEEAIDALTAAVALDFLLDAKDAGVRAILEWQPDEDEDMFCFAGGTGLGWGLGRLAGARTAGT
jgi:hypothetical protein